MLRRHCLVEMPGGRRCEAPPGRQSEYCFWHDPGKAEDLAEAQRLGGIRRKRERTIAAAFDFEGLASVDAIRRLLEIATTDAMSLENSIARSRTLVSVAQQAMKLLEVGDIAERIAALENVLPRAAKESAAQGRDSGL